MLDYFVPWVLVVAGLFWLGRDQEPRRDPDSPGNGPA
jgi:hypothetical protein